MRRILSMLFASIIITACESSQRIDLASTLVSTVTSARTDLPTHSVEQFGVKAITPKDFLQIIGEVKP